MQALSTTHSLHMKIVYQSLAIPFRLDWTSVFFIYLFFVLFVFPVQVVTVLLYVDCEDQQSLCLAIKL